MTDNKTTSNQLTTSELDISQLLTSDEVIIELLTNALKNKDDDEYFYRLLRHIAKAKGITEISKITGLNRTSLYKSLAGKNPGFNTICKVLQAIGVSIHLEKA